MGMKKFPYLKIGPFGNPIFITYLSDLKIHKLFGPIGFVPSSDAAYSGVDFFGM